MKPYEDPNTDYSMWSICFTTVALLFLYGALGSPFGQHGAAVWQRIVGGLIVVVVGFVPVGLILAALFEAGEKLGRRWDRFRIKRDERRTWGPGGPPTSDEAP